MKKNYILVLLCFATSTIFAQTPELDSWILNTTNKTSSYWQPSGSMQSPTYTFVASSDLADVLSVCYDNNNVWIEAEGMTNDMGQFNNPNTPSAQGFAFEFPRNPVAGSGTEQVPEENIVGVLTNGIPMFGLSDGKSYQVSSGSTSPMGDGVWVGEAYYSEGPTLDTAFAAHPQQTGRYHSHSTPFRLYDDPGTVHSPIVGFANDGFPVYGPFGYTTATDNTSGVSRMTSSYQLRNITVRTLLPDGSTASSAGPAVTNGGQWDLGAFIQDYEYISSLGTLDEHNGRYCVTPEYPNGTYAYFVTVDVAGTPQFPFYVGTTYYGTPVSDNNEGTATIPTSGITCLSTTSVRESDFLTQELDAYPNPSKNAINLTLPQNAKGSFDVKIIDHTGKLVYGLSLIDSNEEITVNISELPAGIYVVRIIGDNQLFTSKFIKE